MSDPKTSGLGRDSEQWRQAWAAYWSDRAPFDRAVAELKVGDGSSAETVLRYLEERPRFLQSGYIAERMLRFANRADWSDADFARLVSIVRMIAAEGYSREAREAQRLLARWGVAGDGAQSSTDRARDPMDATAPKPEP